MPCMHGMPRGDAVVGVDLDIWVPHIHVRHADLCQGHGQRYISVNREQQMPEVLEQRIIDHVGHCGLLIISVTA